MSENFMRSGLPTILLMTVCPISAAFAAEADVFSDGPRLLTKDQLDSLEVRVRFAPHWIEQEKQLQQRLRQQPDDAALKETVQQQQQRRAELEKSPIGVFLPKTVFRLDEPVHAYFVVKNTSAELVDLDMRLDLQLGLRTVNACSIDLRFFDGSRGAPAELLSESVWECGGPPRLTLPPGGYYCTRADLRRIGADAAGDYAIRWGYSGLTSQEVKFTIAPSKEKAKTSEKPVRAIRVARLVSGDRDGQSVQEVVADQPPPPPVIRSARLAPLSVHRFAASLAVEKEGRLYPDIFDLPSQDQFVSARLHLEMPRDEDSPTTLILTLTPRQENEALVLEQFDNLVLMATSRAEVRGPAHAIAYQERPKAKRAERGYSLADPDKPLRIRVELEQDWPRRLGLSGPVELRLLLSSEPVKLQGSWPTLRRLESRVLYAFERKPWNGLLCTPAVHFDVPQP
jgi:hypothetical protein